MSDEISEPLGYLTPETLPATTIDRVLTIPDDLLFIANFTGAMLPLIDPENWQDFGAIAPDDAAAAALQVILGYLGISIPTGGDMELIAEYPLQTATVSSISLTALPDTFQALMILIQARSDRASNWDEIELQFQADAGDQYGWINLWQDFDILNIFNDFDFSENHVHIGACAGNNAGAEFLGFNVVWIYNYASLVDRKPIVHKGQTYGDMSSIADLDVVDGIALWNRATMKVEEINLQPSIGSNFVRAGVQVFGVG